MIRLSNGHTFEYMAASGSLGIRGKGWLWEQPLSWVGLLDPSLFTVVGKTLTLPPNRGNLRWYNPFSCIRFIPDGVVNAVALTNLGLNWWCRKVGPKVDSAKAPLVCSIFGEPYELAEMATILNDYDLVAVEIDASCPTTKSDILRNTKKVIASCEAVKQNSRHPSILKLSAVHEIGLIVPFIRGLVEAISINSVPWEIVFPDQVSPLAHLGGGGVSGKVAQPFTWKIVERIAALTEIPVIGPSVWDFEDLAKVRLLGAKAIGFGSIFLRYPWRPTLFVRREQHKA